MSTTFLPQTIPAAPAGTSWYRLYLQDRKAMLDTMRANLAADLAAGYDPNGSCILRQQQTIDEFRQEIGLRVDMLWMISDDEKEIWCYYELLELGAIT